MRIAAAAVMFLLLTGAAHAQEGPKINLWGGDKYVDPERAEKQREIDKAYKDRIKSQPAQAPASNDPWGNVRASEAPKSKPAGSKNR